MSIAENIKQVLSELPDGVRLVAVSKFHPNEAIEEAYSAGQRVFGESKVQEMTAKYESLPKISNGISSDICKRIKLNISYPMLL